MNGVLPMRAIFDLKHPAQVRFFEPVVRALEKEGAQILVTARDKDETVLLLQEMGLEYQCISHMASGFSGMGVELAARTVRMLALARRFKPDVLVARTGITIGLVGRTLGIPCVVFDDTEFAWLQRDLSAGLATVICTGFGYGHEFPGKHLRFRAPPHLMYTHPNRFCPDPVRLRRCGLDVGQPFVVLRFKAWRALHDRGVRGPTLRQIGKLCENLRPLARPVISSERQMPQALRVFANPLPPGDMLHLLAHATLCIGEGSCTVAEAACLGTPSIFASPESRRGYLDALSQDYGLVKTVQNLQEAAEQAYEWLADPARNEWAEAARKRLLHDCTDPLDFAVHVIRRWARDGGARQ